MPEGFLDRMRMSGNYALPSPQQSDVYQTFMNRIYPMLHQQRFGPQDNPNAPQDFNTQLNQQIRTRQALGDIASQKPQDVIYQPPVSDTLESKKLDLAAEDMAMKRDLLKSQLGLKEEEQARKGQETNIHQQRADIYGELVTNPNMKIVTAAQSGDGHVYMYDAKDKTGKMIDKGINSLSKEDEIKLDNAGKLGVATANIAGREKVEGMREGAAKDIQTMKGTQAEEQIKLRGAFPNKNLELPTQEAKAIQTRAFTLISQNPEYKNYIDFDPTTNMPTVKAPFKPWFGPALTADMAKEINEYIYGKGKTGLTKPGETSTEPLEAVIDPKTGKLILKK